MTFMRTAALLVLATLAHFLTLSISAFYGSVLGNTGRNNWTKRFPSASVNKMFSGVEIDEFITVV